MPTVPSGGPSTINGVLYQLLFSLLSLRRFRAVDHELAGDRLDRVTLVLEPSAGGDQQALYPGRRIVTQLKAKADGGPWSLQEVVREVLPDLYRAVDLSRPNTEFHFVTEGRRGRWQAVEELFRRLPERRAGDLLDQLDDQIEIDFGRGHGDDSYWGQGPYTARTLFLKAVETIRERTAVGAEPIEETYRKTWHLLRGFRLVGGLTQESLQARVDGFLLQRIGSADRIAEKRDHLLVELARRACAGDAEIQADEFLASQGLGGTDLTEWAILSRKAHEHLAGVLRRKQADMSVNARPGLVTDLQEGWTDRSPVVLLAGESGSGKTWLGYQALLAAAGSGDVVLLVDARGDADRDLEAAAETFWHNVFGVDEAPPLSRLRARLERLQPGNADRRFTLLVDNVTSLFEARQLAESDWEGSGVRLVMTCASGVAEAIRPILAERGRVIPVPDYSPTELRAYLTAVGIPWQDVPFDVMRTIRRPLLASLFANLVTPDGWRPTNEYELFERSWNALPTRGVRPLDLDGLRETAARTLDITGSYPWAARDLQAHGVDGDAADRLVAAGWIRETADGRYEVWHDRLLNWTIASAIVHECLLDPAAASRWAPTVAGLLVNPRSPSGRMLSYVPMDVLWLVAAQSDRLPAVFSQFVTACEAVLGPRAPEVLLKELLPTLGARAVPYLLNRLIAAAMAGPAYLVNNIIEGLVAAEADDLTARIEGLLGSPEPKVRRAAARLLTRRPSATALDRLWQIHVESTPDPAPYLWEREHRYSLYEDTFGALRSCARLDLGWLERTINEADSNATPVYDLTYLVSHVRDPGLWERTKATLVSKVDASHERSIASCILTFRDRGEIAWLEARVGNRNDIVGPVAIRALTAIDPDRALALLDRLPDNEQYLARTWWLPELRLRLPADFAEHFARTLRGHDQPLRYALILQGRENLIDADAFDFLLDRLTDELAATMTPGTPPNISAACRTGLQFVKAVNRPELLDRLRRRRGSALEHNLADWAISLGPQLGEWKVPDKFDALEALARIGGEGFSRVLDDWLQRAGWGGQYHAVEMALRRSSPRTVELLTELSATGGSGDEEHRSAMSGYATATLAALHQWEPVIRYYLRVGLSSLNVVEDRFPGIEVPLDDAALADAISEFRGAGGPTPGSVLVIALAGRQDFLPELRATLESAESGSDLAAACLIALRWLGDHDPASVPAIGRQISAHTLHATNALFANGSAEADQELLAELGRNADLRLALILANNPRHRTAAVAALCRRAADTARFRWDGNLTNSVAHLGPEALALLAACPEVAALAEEIGFAPYEPSRVPGEKPAALRIVGARDPDAALQFALSRLRSPETPDGELYVPLVASLAPARATIELLAVVRLDPPTRVVRAIGRELGRLGAASTVCEWLRSDDAEERLAACRVAGFLPPTGDIEVALRAAVDDAERRVSEAAVEAIEHIERARIADELVQAIETAYDVPYLWVLLDALAKVTDPDESGRRPDWAERVGRRVTQAMACHLDASLKERRKKLREELDRLDRQRR